VANRGSGTVTVIDVANRRVRHDHDGSRAAPRAAEPTAPPLRRAPRVGYLATFEVPSLVPLPRVYVGLGVTTMKVDPRTDLIYLSRERAADHGARSARAQQIDQLEVPARSRA
jgi:hypothetical protein